MRYYRHRRSLHYRKDQVSLYHWFVPAVQAQTNQIWSVPASMIVQPVPINLDNKKTMELIGGLVPSWSAIGWIVATGATVLCGAIFYQCVKNQAFLDVLK